MCVTRDFAIYLQVLARIELSCLLLDVYLYVDVKVLNYLLGFNLHLAAKLLLLA